MSKELPYFRFYVSEWLNDDISIEDEITKGVFIDVCAFYWFRDCSITKAMLKKRFSNNEEQLNNLFNAEIIKEKNGNEFIEIKFLDIQFDELSELRKRRQEAGRKGGKQGLSKPKVKRKQNTSYKDKDNNKDKIKNREDDFTLLVFEFSEKYPEEMLNRFIDYWTEKNKSKTKMRFELEKTFEISKRLATWASRDKDYNKVETNTRKTHTEMLQLADKNPGIWDEYTMIKENGKAIYIKK